MNYLTLKTRLSGKRDSSILLKQDGVVRQTITGTVEISTTAFAFWLLLDVLAEVLKWEVEHLG